MSKQPAGFGIFSDFLKALDWTAPVNCDSLVQQNPGRHGLTYCHVSVVCTQVQSDGVIYHRFPVDHYPMMGGTLMGEVHDTRSMSAYTETVKLLQGHTVRRAVLAMPKNLQYLDGQNDLLRYDKESDSFVVRS